jgi:hypothetical protein
MYFDPSLSVHKGDIEFTATLKIEVEDNIFRFVTASRVWEFRDINDSTDKWVKTVESLLAKFAK